MRLQAFERALSLSLEDRVDLVRLNEKLRWARGLVLANSI